MKQTIMLTLALAATFSFALQGQERGVLDGYTLDLRGNPVAGVELNVVLTSEPSVSRTAQSDEDGKFTLRSMDEGLYAITASKAGYRAQPVQYNQPAVGSTSVHVLLVSEDTKLADLGPQAKVSGKIVDTKRQPIEGVTITFTTGLFPDYKEEATTGRDGSFSGVSSVNWAIVQAYMNKNNYRDSIHQFSMEDQDMTIGVLEMKTLEEAYAELGVQQHGEMSPEDQAVALYNQAVTPYQNKQWEVAEKLAKQALELNPGLTGAQKMLAYVNYQTQDWKEVVQYASQVLETSPKDKDMIKLALDAANRVQDNDTVSRLNKKMADMELVNAGSVYDQAVAALNANNDDQAKPLLQKVLGMDDKFADAYYQLGMVFIRAGDFESALTNLKLFLKHAPKDDRKRQEVTDLIVTLSE